MAIPDDQSAESYNIELRQGGLGKKRAGSDAVALTYSAGSGLDTRQVSKFIPSNDIAASELWIVSYVSAGVNALYRVPGNASSAVLLGTGLFAPASFAQLNGKYFIASQLTGTPVNRIQVYVPGESTSTIRYAGLKPEAAPTVADTGSGVYGAVARRYRVVTLRIDGSTIVSQSEPSDTVSFVPSGSGAAARVTHASVSGEGETHWQVQAAGTNNVYWVISTNIPIATTTFDDSTDPSSYPSVGTTPDEIGSHYPFPSVRYLLSDGTRLFGLGVYATTPQNSLPPVAGRLYFTPVLGSSDTGDDERIVSTTTAEGWIDLAIGGGGVDRGIAGPLNNNIVAFQLNGVYLFIPTTNPDLPYRRVVQSTRVGSLSGASVVMAEDGAGQPAIYFLDPRNGPYRLGQGGFTQTWIGKDVKDLWNSVNIASTTPETSYWGVYDISRKLVIWHVLNNSGGTTVLMFDITNAQLVGPNEIRKGWTQWSAITDAASSGVVSSGVMFPSTLTTTHPILQVLYYGILSTVGPPIVYRVNGAVSQDGTANYQAYILSRAYRWPPLGRLRKLLEAVLVAKSRAATSVLIRIIGDWGKNAMDRTISIAPSASETYVRVRPNPMDDTELVTLQVQLGDDVPANTDFELESFEMQVEKLEEMR